MFLGLSTGGCQHLYEVFTADVACQCCQLPCSSNVDLSHALPRTFSKAVRCEDIELVVLQFSSHMHRAKIVFFVVMLREAHKRLQEHSGNFPAWHKFDKMRNSGWLRWSVCSRWNPWSNIQSQLPQPARLTERLLCSMQLSWPAMLAM